MLKKYFNLFLIPFTIFLLTSCSNKGCDLLILNWGDYISSDLIDKFEEEYNVKVKEVTTDSNESFYSKIQNKSASYDLVFPSDYMIDQMAEDGLIYELDFTKLTNYKSDMFIPELNELINSKNCISYKNYHIPYFWSSLGIMYQTTRYDNLEEIIKKYSWKVFFEPDLLPEGCRVGMYSSSRDALAAAELYLGYDLNTTNTVEIDNAMSTLKNATFYEWGTDDLKLDVSSHKLDIALVYSGDYFDAYYSDLEAEGENSTSSNVDTYSIYAPTDRNNIFFDSMCIPKTSTNIDLAYKFIDFMIDYENNLENCNFVGYCPTLNAVYETFKTDGEHDDVIAIDAYHPAKIVNGDGYYCVYSYLGKETYSYIERKFTSVIFR